MMPLILACLAASISIDAVLIAAPPSTQPADAATRAGTPLNTLVQREQAARALLAENTDASRQALVRYLEDASDPMGQLAAARAVVAAGNVDRAFLVPLRLMMGTDRALTEAAAQALARFQDNPEAVRLLVNFASARQQRETDRLMVIRAIGTLADRAAAEFLVSLLLRDDDSPRIRNAAGDALIDMTGETTNGRDAARWQAWWTANAKKPEAQWKQEIIARQATRFVQMRSQYEQLVNELQNTLAQVYEATPTAQQPALLLTYLRSSHAEIRRFGAITAYNDAMAAKPIGQEAREQLRSMIGDASREVRLAVANALLATNDPGALDALLLQLQREPDPEVRAVFAAPIASIGDLRAVPALRALLKDNAMIAATAAASALRELGPIIHDRNPQLAHEIAVDLRTALDRAGTGPASLAFREAIAESLVPLRDPEMMQTLYRLLRDADSTRIRWAALRALGELKDAKAADTIARYLEDRESGVRLEAVRALGKTSPAEHAGELYRRMNSVEETDSSVRDEAWNVLQTLGHGQRRAVGRGTAIAGGNAVGVKSAGRCRRSVQAGL